MNIGQKGQISSSNQKTDLPTFRRQLPQTGIVVRRTKSFYYVDVGDVEPRLCRIRGNLFQGNSHKYKIAVGDEVEIDNIDLNTGVLQGDTLAPYIFVIILSQVTQYLEHSSRCRGQSPWVHVF